MASSSIPIAVMCASLPGSSITIYTNAGTEVKSSSAPVLLAVFLLVVGKIAPYKLKSALVYIWRNSGAGVMLQPFVFEHIV